MKLVESLAFAGILVGLALPVAAQQSQTGQGESMSGMKNMSTQTMSPYQKETMTAMEKMNKAMMDGMMDSDTGKAWMRSMAAHHQGAIDMSEIVLKNTKDSDVVKEANKTVKDNQTALKELEIKMKKDDKKG